MLNEDGAIVSALPMPTTDEQVLLLLGHRASTERYGYMENVHSSPQMGVTSAFTFGHGVGALKMALVACSIPFQLVTPQTWQTKMGCRTGGDKNISKNKAQKLFPSVKVTHAIADALIIAEYGRRAFLGIR